MRLGEDAAKAEDRFFRLAPGLDPTALELTPGEGYLLSRIDGRTPCSALRQIGGLPPSEVDRCLELWLEQGVIEVAEPEAGSGALGSPETVAQDAPAGPALDPSLDLALEIQSEVLAFAARLDRPYHELLGVDPDADARAVKKAYFGLSKRLHPDRYFRRNVGTFAPLIERCFKKLLEAYEMLSDPMARAEMQRSLSQDSEPGPRPSGVEVRQRLRRRASKLGGQHRDHGSRRRKAKGFFESGMAAFGQGRWLEAAGSVRLAIAFDPDNQAYRDRFAEVQCKAHDERAKVLIKQAESALDIRDYREAFSLLEEACNFRPVDAELNFRTARIAWQALGELRQAKEYAATACEIEPENGLYRRTLGQIYAAAGLESNARRELRAALRLEPNDKEAKSALKSL